MNYLLFHCLSDRFNVSKSINAKKSFERDHLILPILHIPNAHHQFNENIRKELIIRLLTAMSIDYEKQWYLGMVRRKTLNILIKSVEQAKQKSSLELHWKLIEEHFRLSIFLRLLMKFDSFSLINQWTNRLLFNHIFRTIELTLSKSIGEEISISFFFFLRFSFS